MTRIDFYLLQGSSAGSDDKPGIACRLAEKAYRLGHRIYVYTADAAATRELDELLWLFSPGSFVPHAPCGNGGADDAAADTPVLVGHCSPPADAHDVLISLAPQVPEFFSRFQRLIELVGTDADDKAQSRERFRFYRDRGYDLHTHNL